jgi:CubicO group peptidase (beta-lactamase class C family)
VASNTKVFMATLLYLMVEDGLLDLDDSVSKYAPTFNPLNQFDASKITFRQLASHMSGLPDSLPGSADWYNISTETVFSTLGHIPLQMPCVD